MGSESCNFLFRTYVQICKIYVYLFHVCGDLSDTRTPGCTYYTQNIPSDYIYQKVCVRLVLMYLDSSGLVAVLAMFVHMLAVGMVVAVFDTVALSVAVALQGPRVLISQK